MQYPPQQPGNQPYYAPSEMFGQEQVQIYAPAHEITQPHMLAQEIAIYPNRAQAIWRTILIVAVLVIELVILIPLTLSTFSSIQNVSPDGSPFIPMIIFFSLLFLFLLAYIGLMTWRMASLIFARKPLLVINREGIRVGRVPARSGFFIPWTEVEAISSRTFMYKYLCIRPRNQKEFLKRFNWWERFIRLSNSIFGIPPLIVPQVFLARPVEEILSTLYYGYASELTYYHVQLRP